MKRHQLTVQFVRTVTRPGRYGDGMGLMLWVKPGKPGNMGGKSWVQRLTIRGRRRDIGLGSALAVSLADARKAAFQNWVIAKAGEDPTRDAAAPTFAEALESVIEMQRGVWKGDGKSEHQWRSSMAAYVLPRLGRRTVDQIDTADVMAVLLPIWTEKRETAKRIRQRIGAVMLWSVAQGHRTDNSAGDAIGSALPRNGARTAHQRALPYSAVADALKAVKAARAWPLAALCLEFLTLTAARSGEARLATWDEVDLDAAVWTVPPERMKGGRAHRVPLSPRAMAVLREAAQYRDRSGLIFPPSRGAAISGAGLSRIMRELDLAGTPHGMRSAFRDWAAERSTAPKEIAEMALAHVEGSAVERAYRRTDLFEKRRSLMDSWSRYLAPERAANVVNI